MVLPSSNSAGTADSLPVGWCARAMSWAWARPCRHLMVQARPGLTFRAILATKRTGSGSVQPSPIEGVPRTPSPLSLEPAGEPRQRPQALLLASRSCPAVTSSAPPCSRWSARWRWWREGEPSHLRRHVLLHGDCQSLLAALAYHWVDHQLGAPAREVSTEAPARPNRSKTGRSRT
jgi:hypothetical protein